MLPMSSISHNGCRDEMVVLSPPSKDLICKNCGANYDTERWKIEPYPYPFIEQKFAKCCILMKPKFSSFYDYTVPNPFDLGICDSKSQVFFYSSDNVEVQSTSWDESTVVYDFSPLYADNPTVFDTIISNFLNNFEELVKKNEGNRPKDSVEFLVLFLKFIDFNNYGENTLFLFIFHYLKPAFKKTTEYVSLLKFVKLKGYA